jgi:hypothetical protein
MNRRHLLTMGGAGVAALALPSFLPGRVGGSGITLAHGNPMLTELTSQFRRALASLTANPPRGNARQLAALYRMASAWARANEIDTQLRQRLDAEIASEGHHAFVTRVALVDYAAEAKKGGLRLPPNVRNPDARTVARAIGMLKGGMTCERAWRITAFAMEAKAPHFDRMMAIANGRRPTDGTTRLIQDDTGCTDPDCSGVELPPQDDCVQNADGSFSCAFSNPTVVPDGPDCNSIDFLFDLFQVEWALLALLLPELTVLAIMMGLGFEAWEWYIGC